MCNCVCIYAAAAAADDDDAVTERRCDALVQQFRAILCQFYDA